MDRAYRKSKLLQTSVCQTDDKLKASASRIAKTLETILFTKSESADDHANPERMKQNLQTMVQALQQRRQLKQNMARQEFLRKILGPEKHAQVKQLVQQIKLERLKKASEGCAQCRVLENGATVCPMPEKGTKGSKSFPTAVKRLFFQVDLIHALEFKSLQTWRETKWDDLIAEAKAILQEYQDWKNMR